MMSHEVRLLSQSFSTNYIIKRIYTTQLQLETYQVLHTHLLQVPDIQNLPKRVMACIHQVWVT